MGKGKAKHFKIRRGFEGQEWLMTAIHFQTFRGSRLVGLIHYKSANCAK
jgi:hypothetical protein